MIRALRVAALGVFALGLVTGAAWAQDDLPPGHPSVNEDDPHTDNPHDGPSPHDAEDPGESPPDADNPHGGNPHGQNPHGNGGGEERLFNAPPDGSQDDPALKAGTLSISIRNAEDKPVPRAPVLIEVLHATVAKGESRERLTKVTNDAGDVTLDGLQVGAGTSYRVSTTRGDGTFAAPPFTLGDKAGKRALVHAYDSSHNIEDLLVGGESIVYMQLRQDAIQVEQLVTIYNFSPTAWIADASGKLPEHFKAFNKQESTEEGRVEEVNGEGFALRGTFAPGRHDLEFSYSVPLDQTERQSFHITLPPHTGRGKVMVEAGRAMTIDVANFPPAQRTPMNGKRVLATERVAQRGEGGVRTFDITINGLPTPGPGRWVAVALAAMAIFGGIYTVLSRDKSRVDPDALGDLEEAREALLGEIVTLERLHKSGEIGPRTYGRIRASLLDALARIVDQIAAQTRPKKKRPARTAARGAS